MEDSKAFIWEENELHKFLFHIFVSQYFFIEFKFSRMVNVEKGMLVTVDPPIKQFLLFLDERKEYRGRRFVIKGIFLKNLDKNFIKLSIIIVTIEIYIFLF